jgi:hypothetical protein
LEYLYDCQQNSLRRRNPVNERKGEHTENWYLYLRIAYGIEPIGHHYLRTLVLRLKFERGSFAACGIAMVGIWFFPITHESRALISLLPIGLMLVFYFEAKWTHELLSRVRRELLKGISEWPEQSPRPIGKVADAQG